MNWKREILRPKTAVHHPSTCSGMIKVGPFLFMAGQIAMDENRYVVQGYKDIDEEGRKALEADVNWGRHFREEKAAAQTWQVFTQIKRMLQDAGTDMENIISLRIYLCDINHFPIVERIRNMFYKPDNMPIITTMQVVSLCPPEALLEIEVEAFLPNEV